MVVRGCYSYTRRIILALIFLLPLQNSLTESLVITRQIVRPSRNYLFELSIIHLNDFHARFVETDPNSGNCLKGKEDDCVGGIARIYTASERLLKERRNPIFLNAGDNFQGTLWYKVHRWNVTSYFMNILSQDAMTIGNHEFDNGIAGLVPFLTNVNTSVVVTNIDDENEPVIQGLYTNSTVVERNGTKIGIIGVIISNTDVFTDIGNLKLLDEVESVNAEAERLKNQGIEIIIVLSHCGIELDRIMAADCPNIDVIVGGHSHTFLYSGTRPPSYDLPRDEYPVVVEQTKLGETRNVLIVQAGAFSKYLGNLTVWFDESGEAIEWEGNPILLDNSIEQDPRILAALVPWQETVDRLDSMVIGYANVALTNANCYFAECNLGNLITDAMVDAYVDNTENSTHWTYASIACINAAGIHTQSLNKTGNITYGDATYHLTYENTWDVLELRGSDLIKVLEYSVAESYSSSEFIGKRFLQWSGIKVTFDLGKEVNRRVTSLKIKCQKCEMPFYEDVIDDEWYRVVVPYFLFKGGDGYTIIKNRHRNHRSGILNTEYYPKYIEKKSPINIGVEGRITFVRNRRGG